MARLRADPALVPHAIEEALRFDSPVQGLFRTNADRVHARRGDAPAADKVQLLFGSANRDAEQFGRTRTSSASTGTPTSCAATSPSAGGSTTASARRWPVSRPG